MISIDTRWLLERMGVQVDPELIELGTLVSLRFKNAPDKKQFAKDALRAVLGEVGTYVTKPR